MNDEVLTTEALDIAEILKALPHRYPFLMVDRIIELRSNESAIGIKNVTVNEPHFLGHFPGNPVFPAVLLIEGMAQTAGVLCFKSLRTIEKPLVYFLTIDKAVSQAGGAGDARATGSRSRIWRIRPLSARC